VNLPGLEKKVEKISFYQLQNVLYKGKLHYGLSEAEAQELCSHLLPQYSLVEEEDSLATAIQLVQAKHNREIEKVKAHFEKNQIKLIEEKNTSKALENETHILEDRLKTLESENNFYLEVIQSVLKDTFECPVCLSQIPNEKMVMLGCLHMLCAHCYEQLIKNMDNPECPYCKDFIEQNQLIIHPKYREGKHNKLTKLVEAVSKVPQDEKVIIFTQFHSLVERLENIFDQLDLSYMVLRGDPTEINIALNKFKEVPEIKILLMSIEQAASGINVTAANHVFFAHPIFGMSFDKAAITYNQCIGRAYRIGQKKKVYVKMFVTENSIEEDILPSFWKY